MDENDLHDLVRAVNELLTVKCISCHNKFLWTNYTSTACSLCARNAFHDSGLSLLKTAMQLFPKPCKYSNKGCTAISILDRQELFCEYRPIKCRVGEDSSCVWNGTVKDWQTHVKTDHGSFVPSYRLNTALTLALVKFKNPWNFRCFRHLVDDNLFYLYMKKMNGQLYQSVKHIPLKKPKTTYFFTVDFRKNNEMVYKYTIEAKTLDENEPIEDSFDNVCVSIDDLTGLLNNDGDLNVTFQVNRKDSIKDE